MATTTIDDAATALDRIHDDYIRAAAPALSRAAEITEQIGDELRSRFRNPESAAKRMSSVEGIPPLIAERGKLLADIRSAGNRTRMALDQWFEARRADHRRAQVHDPEADTPEGQQRRLLALATADELSALPPDELLVEGKRLAAMGDLAGASIRLTAAKLAGSNRPGKLRELREKIDRELDRTVPHRIAATETLKAAYESYRSMVTVVIKTEMFGGDLSKASPMGCDREVDAAIAWALEMG